MLILKFRGLFFFKKQGLHQDLEAATNGSSTKNAWNIHKACLKISWSTMNILPKDLPQQLTSRLNISHNI